MNSCKRIIRYATVASLALIVAGSAHAEGTLAAGQGNASEQVCSSLRPGCLRDSKYDEFFCGLYSLVCDVRIGVVGDSNSDEYQGATVAGAPLASGGFAALVWVEQLGPHVSMGSYEGDPSVRGAPRHDGFEYNWSRYAQAMLDLQFTDILPLFLLPPAPIPPYSAQIEGLSAQIAAGEIDVAVVTIGGNDFNLRNFLGIPVDDAFYQAVSDRYIEAVKTLQNAGNAKVIATLPPYLYNPARQAQLTPLNEDLRARLEDLGVPSFEFFSEYLFPRTDFDDMTLTVGGETITIDAASTAELAPAGSPDATGPCIPSGPLAGLCSTPSYARHFTLQDGLHPGTVAGGLRYNAVIQEINEAFGFKLRTHSEEQILNTAGL